MTNPKVRSKLKETSKAGTEAIFVWAALAFQSSDRRSYDELRKRFQRADTRRPASRTSPPPKRSEGMAGNAMGQLTKRNGQREYHLPLYP